MIESREMICILCPRGCRIKVTKAEDGTIKVENNYCPRGITYGETEVTNPVRMITSTVFITSSTHKLLPVVTNSPIPKGLIFDIMAEINKVHVKAPIKRGDVIIKNVLNTGSDIVASKSIQN